MNIKKGTLRFMNIKESSAHFILIIFIALLLVPIYCAFVAASHDGAAMLGRSMPYIPGGLFLKNCKMVFMQGVVSAGGQPIWLLLVNSLIMAGCIAVGKIILALFSAFALIYFELPGKKILFALIFSTMMLPIEVRVLPTFQIVASLNWLNSYQGLTLPLMASATATFLFIQFFKTLSSEMIDAATLDGASPWHIFCDIVLPLSKAPIIALFIILFIFGWNQYLWPLIVTSDNQHTTIVMGIRYLAGVADQIPQWHYIMCVALIALLPPCALVLSLQRWFEKGLVY